MALPTSYTEAVKHTCWKKAIKAEIEAIKANHTWEIVDLHFETVHIDCKIVYKIKHKANGDLEIFKVIIVAKGFTQQEWVDYIDMFSPIEKMNIIRVLLALIATNSWLFQQMDMNNAFLHGDLTEEIYMNLPKGYHIPKGIVLQLKKSHYGLK